VTIVVYVFNYCQMNDDIMRMSHIGQNSCSFVRLLSYWRILYFRHDF